MARTPKQKYLVELKKEKKYILRCKHCNTGTIDLKLTHTTKASVFALGMWKCTDCNEWTHLTKKQYLYFNVKRSD